VSLLLIPGILAVSSIGQTVAKAWPGSTMIRKKNGHLNKTNESLGTLRSNVSQIFLFIRVLAKEFRQFFAVVITIFAVSCCILYFFYPRADLPHQQLTWLQTAYCTWLMIFFENPLPFVEHWLISPLFFLLPLLGLVTVAEGVVHLGNLLFQQQRYSKEWQQMIAGAYEGHIVVCGLGNVGVRVVQHLLRLEEKVVAIEAREDARFINEVQGYLVPVLVGDCRDGSTLEKANITHAKAVICVTDNDLVNLETALTSREYNPTLRVVIRMFDQKMAKKVERSMGIGAAYSSSARSSRLFAQAAISENILDSFEFGGTIINAYQLIVAKNTALVGATIDDVRQKHEVTVLLHETSNGELDWNPSPVNILGVGDRLLIMTDRDGIKRLEQSTKPLSKVKEPD
jgi:Trk K+ transport system NAD-binding subunit